MASTYRYVYREIDGWLSIGRWVAKSGTWVAKLVAPACFAFTAALGSNPDISQKYKMGDISKGVPTLSNTQKK